jgi:hypothetical protein
VALGILAKVLPREPRQQVALGGGKLAGEQEMMYDFHGVFTGDSALTNGGVS